MTLVVGCVEDDDTCIVDRGTGASTAVDGDTRFIFPINIDRFHSLFRGRIIISEEGWCDGGSV